MGQVGLQGRPAAGRQGAGLASRLGADAPERLPLQGGLPAARSGRSGRARLPPQVCLLEPVQVTAVACLGASLWMWYFFGGERVGESVAQDQGRPLECLISEFGRLFRILTVFSVKATPGKAGVSSQYCFPVSSLG